MGVDKVKNKPLSKESSRYTRPDAIATTKRAASCQFGHCNDDCFAGLPVCFMCALMC